MKAMKVHKTTARDLLDGQTVLARKRAELIAQLRQEIAALTAENACLRREIAAARRDRRTP